MDWSPFHHEKIACPSCTRSARVEVGMRILGESGISAGFGFDIDDIGHISCPCGYNGEPDRTNSEGDDAET